MIQKWQESVEKKGADPRNVGGRGIKRYNNEDFTEYYGASIGMQPSQYKGKVVGYIIHASCWVLLTESKG